jgi:hypothetical protein
MTQPMYLRRLTTNRPRVCKSPGGTWWAERRLPLWDAAKGSLHTHQCKAFATQPEAIAQATTWAPKKAAKP